MKLIHSLLDFFGLSPGAGSHLLAGEPAHRKDIDGLRAVAVLPVVAFHAGIEFIRGGFVGVDVFFVISGYLISSLLMKDIVAGKFSILKFYERRVRRIFPALIAVLLATFVMAWFYSLPGELVDLSKSGIAAVLSVSNMFFWMQAGYFDGSALSKPLLHTWSLAVEEQFYIFWPLMLLGAYRFSRTKPVLMTWVVSIVSLIVSAYGAFHFKDASYYLVFTRAWELLLGALVAFDALPVPKNESLREAYSFTGLVLIIASIFMVNGDMPFPGLAAVPPTLGAAMIIAVGRVNAHTVTGRVLSLRLMTFVGLISYSLYLWHWPITVFQRNYGMLLESGSDRTRKIAIIAVSIVAATLSWKFVEQPFREGKYRPSPRKLAWMAGVASAVVLLISACMWKAEGFPSRYSPRAIELASFLNYQATNLYRDETCFLSARLGKTTVDPECVAISPYKPNYLIMGDSHAAQLWSGLHAAIADKNFLQVTAAHCLPTITPKFNESLRCRELFNKTFQSLVGDAKINKVMLAGRWTNESLPAVSETLNWAKQNKVSIVLIGPGVIYDSPLPRLLVTALKRSSPDYPNQHWDTSLIDLDTRMAQLASANGVAYISLLNLVCEDQNCRMFDDQDHPLIFDREHFTERGSFLVAEQIKQML